MKCLEEADDELLTQIPLGVYVNAKPDGVFPDARMVINEGMRNERVIGIEVTMLVSEEYNQLRRELERLQRDRNRAPALVRVACERALRQIGSWDESALRVHHVVQGGEGGSPIDNEKYRRLRMLVEQDLAQGTLNEEADLPCDVLSTIADEKLAGSPQEKLLELYARLFLFPSVLLRGPGLSGYLPESELTVSVMSSVIRKWCCLQRQYDKGIEYWLLLYNNLNTAIGIDEEMLQRSLKHFLDAVRMQQPTFKRILRLKADKQVRDLLQDKIVWLPSDR
jgi:hypothetical protein